MLEAGAYGPADKRFVLIIGNFVGGIEVDVEHAWNKQDFVPA